MTTVLDTDDAPGLDDALDDMMETIALAERVKAAMKRKERRQGWTKCPRCGGRVRCVLAGSRDHLHMSCDGQPGEPCSLVFME